VSSVLVNESVGTIASSDHLIRTVGSGALAVPESKSPMLTALEKIPLRSKAKENALSGAFLVSVVLAMAGWVYLLSSIFLKVIVWSIS
jgi:hypothetical protein